MKANRQFRIRAGNWNSEEERQYRYDVAWEKNDKNLPLSNEEVAILGAGNPGIRVHTLLLSQLFLVVSLQRMVQLAHTIM